MTTQFSDELYAKIATIDDPSGDLADYVDSLGEMFAEVEGLVRESSGRVWYSSELPAFTVRSGNPAWWGYYSEGTRMTLAIDPATSYLGGQTFKAHSLVADADTYGPAVQNQPVRAGEHRIFRAKVKGAPGFSVSPNLNFWTGINAGGTGTGNAGAAIPMTGDWVEVSVEATAPAGANYSYLYLLAPSAVGRDFWIADVEFKAESPDSGKLKIPWAGITNPDLAISEASLRWLAQLAGVKVPVGLAANDMRRRIVAAESRRRGTIAYMVEVAQRLLTGTKTVYTHERVSSAYTLSMATKTSETPDATAVQNALLAVKPAGIVLTYVTTTGVIWDTPTHQWDQASTVTWDASLSTVP